MSDKVLRIEDILQKNSEESSEHKNLPKVKKKKKPVSDTPRGLPKSGRVWKTEKKRFSSIIKTRGYKTANKFEKLQKLKKEINKVREMTREIVDKRNKQIQDKKERRRKNLQRQKENMLKAEVVQVITNTAKLKRMKKKQLRNIEKRDTLNKI